MVMAEAFELSKPDMAAIVLQSALPTSVLDSGLRVVFANAAFCKVLGQTADQLIGRDIFEIFPLSEDLEADFREKYQSSFDGKVTRSVIVPYGYHTHDGQAVQRYWQTTQEPLRDAAGNVGHIVQRVQDVTHLVSLQKSNDFVTAELDHRVKNLVTVILATARITATSAESVEQYTDEFCDRLQSMARVYNKMSANGWQGLTFRELLEDELVQMSGRGAVRYSLKGDHVALSLKATKDGGMILHELVSNAVKHGCFSRPGGQLDVEWRLKGDVLCIEWVESGLTGLVPPEKIGFGMKLLSMIPDVTIQKEYCDTGLKLRYCIPITFGNGDIGFDETSRI